MNEESPENEALLPVSTFVCYSLFFLGPIFYLTVVRSAFKGDTSLWNPQKLPPPAFDPNGVCGRRNPSAICDPNHYLADKEADLIDTKVARAEQGIGKVNTVFCTGSGSEKSRGYRIRIAIVKNMREVFCNGCKSINSLDDDQLAEQIAAELYENWRVSNYDCSNGVLIFVAIRDRQLHIVFGRDIGPRDDIILRKGGALIGRRRYASALNYLIDHITNPAHGEEDGRYGGWWYVIVEAVFMVLFFALGYFGMEIFMEIGSVAFEAGREGMMEYVSSEEHI